MDQDHDEVLKVEVKFRTSLDKYRVTEKPFQVPVNLNRRGLSQVINHLLGNTTKPVPFDFLIQNQFLRTTLEKYMKDHNVTHEEQIIIEYVELLDEPNPSSTATHSDWISSIDNRLLALQSSLLSTGSEGFIIPYGSYDSQVCLYESKKRDENGESAMPLVIGKHEQPVLAVSSYFRGPQRFDLASCSQDGSIYVWNVDLASEKSNMTHRLEGHEGAVEDVQFDPTGKLIASGSWDDSIKIWSLDDAELELNNEDDELRSKTKKKKTKETKNAQNEQNDQVMTVQPRSTLLGHNQCVSTLQWISNDTLVSGSWDHSLRFWDVESGVSTSHFDGNKVILALDNCPSSKLIVTGHADKVVRVWDTRVSIEANSLSTAYVSHTGWVTAVKWHPTNPNLIVSGSYDTSIKVWDIRSSTPLHSLPSQHLDKVTSLSWLDANNFVSGGADKFLRTYNFPTLPTS